MKLYATGLATSEFLSISKLLFTNKKEEEIIRQSPIVESYINLIKYPKTISELKDNNKKVFLFPHLNQNKSPEIDIRDYCKFINFNQDIIEEYSVLFIIHDQLQTYRNQLVMRDLGFVDTIPYLGIGNDHNFLDYYLNNYKRLIVGGLVGSQKDVIGRLNNINFKNKSLHGHGITSLAMLEGFKWDSADTELWRKIANDGDILLSDEEILHIAIDSPHGKGIGKHFLTMSRVEQEIINDIITINDFKTQQLIDSCNSRMIYNLNMLKNVKFKSKVNGLVELFG